MCPEKLETSDSAFLLSGLRYLGLSLALSLEKQLIVYSRTPFKFIQMVLDCWTYLIGTPQTL